MSFNERHLQQFVVVYVRCADYIEHFLPKFVHLYGQQFGGVMEKKSFTSSFLGKK